MGANIHEGHSVLGIALPIYFTCFPRQPPEIIVITLTAQMKKKSSKQIDKLPEHIQPMKTRAGILVHFFFVFLTSKCRILPLHQNFSIMAYMSFLEPFAIERMSETGRGCCVVVNAGVDLSLNGILEVI